MSLVQYLCSRPKQWKWIITFNEVSKSWGGSGPCFTNMIIWKLHERGLRRMWSVNWTERCFCINFIHLIASACMIRAVQVTFNHFHLVLHENIKSEYVIQVQLFWRMFWEHFKSSCFHGPVDFRPRYIVFTCWCFSCCTVWNRQKTDVIFAFVVQAYLQNAFF